MGVSVVALIVGSALGSATACGGGSTPSGFGTADGGAINNGDGGLGGNGEGGLNGGDGGTGVTTSSIFYVHTNTTLYTVDPAHLDAAPTMIGDFTCIGTGKGQDSSMTDIAVSKDGSIYAVSQSNAYPITISGSTVTCGTAWPLPGKNNNFYGLTVAPENTVAASEVLIAADDSGALWQIDQTTGATTQMGTLGTDPVSNKAWTLSGDIVFLANSGSPIGFATVRTCTSTSSSSCQKTDTLIQIDVTQVKAGTQSTLKVVSGAVNKGAWCTNPASPSSFGSMFGIAAYEDKVYGFSNKGDVVEIHNTDGTGCLVNSYTSMAFDGAGVSTIAPVIAPPPR